MAVINPRDRTNTAPQRLWRGVNLKTGEDEEDRVVATLTGSVGPETRVTICAAFNSPLAPDILVCTAIGSEGITTCTVNAQKSSTMTFPGIRHALSSVSGALIG